MIKRVAKKDVVSNRWAKDPKAESVLKKLGFSFTVINISTTDIDWEASQKNCGRMDRLIRDDKIEDYAMFLEEGATKFPMIAVAPSANGYIVASGLHRAKAQELCNPNETFPAYLCNIKIFDDLELFAFTCNRLEGDRTTKEQSMAIALSRVIRSGGKTKEHAKLFLVSESTLRQKYSGYLLTKKIVEHGCTSVKRLTPSYLYKMASLKSQIPVAIALVDYAMDCKLTSDEVYDVCRNMKNLGSEKQKITFIQKEQQLEKYNTAQHSGKVKSRGPYTKHVYSALMRSIKKINDIISINKTLEELQVERGGNEHEQLKKQYREMQRLHKIIR